jgi:hypothetical protein
MRHELAEELERDAASPYDLTDLHGRAERAREAAAALRALRDAPVGHACNFIGNGPTHSVTSRVAFPDGTKVALVPLDTTAGVDRG